MKIALIALGGFLILFGLVDLIGSYAGFDLWYTLGVQLPDVIWSFSHWIEIAIGFFLCKLGLAAPGNG